MSQPKARRLIIVQGQPATGKSTIARKLAKDLGVKLVEKDAIKEFLYEYVGTDDTDWSKMLGQVAIETLYSLTAKLIERGYVTIVETAFWSDVARAEFNGILQRHTVEAIEIFCHVDESERVKRINDRINSGTRHQGHIDVLSKAVKRYEPLSIGEIIDVDTTKFGETDYNNLKERIVLWIEGKK